ncbi:MAG TPA: hypothetical protein VLX68_11960 [Chitinivibrionales bacterium]|nr:hypothetical protein [Chitinivibrionales bacterium]
MMKHRLYFAVIAGIICLGALLQAASAGETDTTANPVSSGLNALGLHFSGFSSSEFGQLEWPHMLSDSCAHQDVMRTYVNFGFNKQLGDRFQIQAAIEGKLYYNTFPQNEKGGVEGFFLPSMYYAFYFDRAFSNFYLGDAESPYLQFTLGYFPFKYNPDARDLGEYLYRSGCYPAVLFNQFDFALARLLGLKISSDLGPSLFHTHLDLILNASTDMPPFFDLNLGGIATFDMAKIFNLGVGAMYQSLVPANDGLTSPHTETIGTGLASNGNAYDVVLDSNGGVASAKYYTAAGLKLMGRFSFDPKRFFGSPDHFLFIGNEGLKLFGEAAILGVQSYPSSQDNPYGYDTLIHKVPIMLGINLPSFDFGSFSIFDVLSLQFEYYDCKYPNNYQYKDQSLWQPVPVPQGVAYTTEPFSNYAHDDNLKWAVYAKKTFKNGLFAVAQVACDHIRNESPVNNFYDSEEVLRTKLSWWMVLKLGLLF